MIRAASLVLAQGALFVLVWETASRTSIVDPALLPPASLVAGTLWGLLGDSEIFRHAGATVWLMARGFGVALLFGVPLGIAMGLSRLLDLSLSPYVDFMRALPAAALIPMFMVLFHGDLARVLVIGLAGGLIIAVACRSGVHSSNPERLAIAKILGFSRVEIVKKIVIWEMLSEFIVGVRIALSLSLILATVLEMLLGARFGLGDLLLNAQPTNKPKMYSVIIVLGVIGYLLNACVAMLESTFVKLGLKEAGE